MITKAQKRAVKGNKRTKMDNKRQPINSKRGTVIFFADEMGVIFVFDATKLQEA